MAKDSFLRNLRTALGGLNIGVWTDSQQLDEDALAKSLGSSDLWLCSGNVADFNAKDFPELSEPQRSKLTQLVSEFCTLADSVPANALSPKATSDRARQVLMSIARLVDEIQ